METLNLHINYDCPLNCRYCVQRNDKALQGQYLTADEMIAKVQTFLDYIQKPKCKVNISGGEPLLKYSDIQKLMETFPNNQYEISTSGILLTEDKVRFFSFYGVNYILSVDGGEKVTKYLRPTADGKLNYFQQLKNNLPSILYYAPYTRAKLIVSKNLISEIFNTYLELEKLGFQEIFITPNVYENEVDIQHPELSTGIWEQTDWEQFQSQIQLIINEIKLGILLNKKRCTIVNIENIIFKSIFSNKTQNDTNTINNKFLICEVLDYKSGLGPTQGQYKDTLSPISNCMRNLIPDLNTQEDLITKAKKDFEKLSNTCPRDEECPFFKTCKYSVCLAENLKDEQENIWIPSNFQCKTQKIYHTLAYDLLTFLEQNKDKEVINQFYFRRLMERWEGK